MNTSVDVSAAVLVHEESDQLVRVCLAALAAELARTPLASELLVVCAPERAEELASLLPPNGRLLPVQVRQVGARRAYAVEQARGEVIAFTDSDCVVQTGWLVELLAALQAADWASGSFGVTVHEFADSLPYQAARDAGLLVGFELASRASAFDWAPCSNVMYRRAAVLAAGNFDRTRDVGEDVELGLRLKATAGPLTAAPNAVVHHGRTEFLTGLWRRAWRWGAGDLQLMIDHAGLAHFAPPPRWLWWLASLAGAAAVGRSPRALTTAGGLWAAVEAVACIQSGKDPRVAFLSRRLSDVFGAARTGRALQRGQVRLAFSVPVYGPGHAREIAGSWASSAREGAIGMVLCLVTAVLQEKA